jgi:hypothetical protein
MFPFGIHRSRLISEGHSAHIFTSHPQKQNGSTKDHTNQEVHSASQPNVCDLELSGESKTKHADGLAPSISLKEECR